MARIFSRVATVAATATRRVAPVAKRQLAYKKQAELKANYEALLKEKRDWEVTADVICFIGLGLVTAHVVSNLIRSSR